jgi:hypothetical protein
VKEHIAAYGVGIEERLTGEHETAPYTKFSYGVSNRGASVRIPAAVAAAKRGYLEDRRPNSNIDPYVVAAIITETICAARRRRRRAVEKGGQEIAGEEGPQESREEGSGEEGSGEEGRSSAKTPKQNPPPCAAGFVLWVKSRPRREGARMASMQSQAQYVLRTVEERGVRFVQLWFTDVLGRHKAFHVTPAELEDALDQGMTFDGSAIDGFSRTTESDLLARPDLTTFQLLPWYEQGRAWRGSSVTSSTSTARPLTAARASNCVASSTTPAPRATPSSSRPRWSTSTSTTSTPRRSRADRPRQLLRPPARRHGESTAPPHRPDLEEMGIGVEHAQHEDAPASTRSTCATPTP